MITPLSGRPCGRRPRAGRPGPRLLHGWIPRRIGSSPCSAAVACDKTELGQRMAYRFLGQHSRRVGGLEMPPAPATTTTRRRVAAPDGSSVARCAQTATRLVPPARWPRTARRWRTRPDVLQVHRCDDQALRYPSATGTNCVRRGAPTSHVRPVLGQEEPAGVAGCIHTRRNPPGVNPAAYPLVQMQPHGLLGHRRTQTFDTPQWTGPLRPGRRPPAGSHAGKDRGRARVRGRHRPMPGCM